MVKKNVTRDNTILYRANDGFLLLIIFIKLLQHLAVFGQPDIVLYRQFTVSELAEYQHQYQALQVNMITKMAEGSTVAVSGTIIRRNLPGTKTANYSKWAEEPFDEMDSTLAVQQYIQQTIRKDPQGKRSFSPGGTTVLFTTANILT